MIGIENIKKAVKFGIDLANQIIKALKDDKITWFESLGFIDELVQLPEVIEAGKSIPAEVEDLSADERQQLHDYVIGELEVPSENVEEVIAASLDLTASAAVLINKIKKIKK